MPYRVIIHPPAKADIGEAWAYIAEQAPMNADRWFNGLYDVIDTLKELPGRGALAPENDLFEEEIRQLNYGNYRILYTIKKKTVHILHVRHRSRRLWTDFFSN